MASAIARNHGATKCKTGRAPESRHDRAISVGLRPPPCVDAEAGTENAESPQGQFRAFWSSRLRVLEFRRRFLPHLRVGTLAHRNCRSRCHPLLSCRHPQGRSPHGTSAIPVAAVPGVPGPAFADTSSSGCTRQLRPWNGTSRRLGFRCRTGFPVLSETFRPRAEVMLNDREETCKSDISISTIYPQNDEICQHYLPDFCRESSPPFLFRNS